MIITNENWIKLGNKFCKLKIDFFRRFKNNEKFILYDYGYIFLYLAENFNNNILLYFNNNDILLKNNIHVSDIFYNMVEFNF